jgi:hypothetical protein
VRLLDGRPPRLITNDFRSLDVAVALRFASCSPCNFDFPGIRIGVAEYPAGTTGVMVFHFPQRVYGAVDTRGGLQERLLPML